MDVLPLRANQEIHYRQSIEAIADRNIIRHRLSKLTKATTSPFAALASLPLNEKPRELPPVDNVSCLQRGDEGLLLPVAATEDPTDRPEPRGLRDHHHEPNHGIFHFVYGDPGTASAVPCKFLGGVGRRLFC